MRISSVQALGLVVGMSGVVAAGACAHVRSESPTASGNARSTNSVVVDGAFEDWPSSVQTVTRAAGSLNTSSDPLSADITAVAERSDARYVYLKIDVSRAVNFYGASGTVSLDFDADGNATTGADGDGLAGTDFAIDMAPFVNGRMTEGATVRVMRGGAVVKTVDTYGLDFVLLPTVATTRAELRIARGRAPDSAGPPVFTGRTYRAQVAVHDASGAIRYRLPAFTATLPALDTTATVATTDPLARAPNTQMRVLQWNVANEGLRDRPEHYRRIFAAIDPDVLILDEVGGVLGNDGVRRFLATIDSGRTGRAPWQYTYGLGGGYQRTVIAARSSVVEYPEFKFIPFPDSVEQRILAAVPANRRDAQRANIDSGVATGGAIVTLNGKRVAVFGVDLQSAGNAPNSWQEQRRRAETIVIRDLAMASIRAHGKVEAVIAAGDHNLVSTREPLDIMRQVGTAFDGSALTSANPLQLDGATAATWEGSGGAFPPGRLDWINYSNASLELLGGFVFDVGDIAPRWRRYHHLENDDSKKSSDHRPVVVDLKWRTR